MISGGSPKIRMQKTARVGGRNVLGHGRWKHGGEGMFLGHGRWNHDIPFWTRTNRQAPILLMEENLHQFTKKLSHYFYSKSQYSPRCRISSINNMTLQTHRNTFWVPFWPLASHQGSKYWHEGSSKGLAASKSHLLFSQPAPPQCFRRHGTDAGAYPSRRPFGLFPSISHVCRGLASSYIQLLNPFWAEWLRAKRDGSWPLHGSEEGERWDPHPSKWF